jgi:putative acetyltransferase
MLAASSIHRSASFFRSFHDRRLIPPYLSPVTFEYLEPGVGEVKRMFVLPEFRGRGIARHILMALESTAQERGYSTLRLETGTRQPEAIGLHKAAGYGEITCFGEYADDLFSVCFEKQLT